jgi:hypothetical protein
MIRGRIVLPAGARLVPLHLAVASAPGPASCGRRPRPSAKLPPELPPDWVAQVGTHRYAFEAPPSKTHMKWGFSVLGVTSQCAPIKATSFDGGMPPSFAPSQIA